MSVGWCFHIVVDAVEPRRSPAQGGELEGEHGVIVDTEGIAGFVPSYPSTGLEDDIGVQLNRCDVAPTPQRGGCGLEQPRSQYVVAPASLALGPKQGAHLMRGVEALYGTKGPLHNGENIAAIGPPGLCVSLPASRDPSARGNHRAPARALTSAFLAACAGGAS